MKSSSASQRGVRNLIEAGVSVWMDDLTRRRIKSGGLKKLIEETGVSGITTNPTIFAASMEDEELYKDQLESLLANGSPQDAPRIAMELLLQDVVAAADLLKPVFESTDGAEGRVSIEVDPTLAHDSSRTVAMARELWAAAARPNLMIKIPATIEGVEAIERVTSEGISVNVTVLFSVSRYKEVAEAYMRGLELALENGLDLSTIRSVASLFVSRIDAEIDRTLRSVSPALYGELRGRAAVAIGRQVHAASEAVFSGPRWEKLARNGAHRQRVLWASTASRNHEYKDTKYVQELVAPGTISTMTEATLEFVSQDEVVPKSFVGEESVADSELILDKLVRAGIEIEKVSETLENAALVRFQESWRELLTKVEDAR